MPILDLQKRARELGRIRIGQKGDRGQPQKLDKFRMTSPSQALIEKVAALYGGEVKPWTPQGGVQQWEVVTTSSRIPIMVPPQPISQWRETWTARGCVHRCTGYTNVLTDEPCDPEDPDHLNAKPTTRLNVVLRDVEGIGVWRLESHGVHAAMELPDVAAFLARAGGYVDGWLCLENRSSPQADGPTRHFVVPTIEIDVTPAQLMAGAGGTAAPQIEGPVVHQLEAAAEDPYSPFFSDLEAANTADKVRDVFNAAKAAKLLGPDSPESPRREALFIAIAEKGKTLLAEPPAAAASPPDDEPDPDVVWQQILTLTGQWEWSLTQVQENFAAHNGGVDPGTASGFELQAYLDGLNQRSEQQAAADEQVPA